MSSGHLEVPPSALRSRPTSPAKPSFADGALPSPRTSHKSKSLSSSLLAPPTSVTTNTNMNTNLTNAATTTKTKSFADQLSKAMLSIDTNHSPVVHQHPHHKWLSPRDGYQPRPSTSTSGSLKPATPSPRASPVPFGDEVPDYAQASPTMPLRVLQAPFSAALSSATTPRVYSAHPSRRSRAFFQSQPFWLALYFFFNLSLTLYNKMVLVRFPFPWTLTALHALCGTVGGYVLLEQGYYVPARTTSRDNLQLLCFSVLYTVNIAVSNVSLQLVTVPFHQVVRASTPLFTIALSILLLRTRLNMQKLLTLLPVIAGVGLATYGDYYFTSWGLFLTLLGTLLASLKTVVTSILQTPHAGSRGIKLHPLDLLLRMSPLAFIQCVMFGWYTGELERVRRYGALEMTRGRAAALVVNGIIAFGLNVVSFTANKKSGPLTMTVAANVKQVLTILLAVAIFNLHINPINGVGILLTVAGGAWYAAIEYGEQTRRSSFATTGRRI